MPNKEKTRPAENRWFEIGQTENGKICKNITTDEIMIFRNKDGNHKNGTLEQEIGWSEEEARKAKERGWLPDDVGGATEKSKSKWEHGETEGSHHGGFFQIKDYKYGTVAIEGGNIEDIESQLEKINGKIEAINAAIEELTRRVFSGHE